jgi:hypothetical protein
MDFSLVRPFIRNTFFLRPCPKKSFDRKTTGRQCDHGDAYYAFVVSGNFS